MSRKNQDWVGWEGSSAAVPLVEEISEPWTQWAELEAQDLACLPGWMSAMQETSDSYRRQISAPGSHRAPAREREVAAACISPRQLSFWGKTIVTSWQCSDKCRSQPEFHTPAALCMPVTPRCPCGGSAMAEERALSICNEVGPWWNSSYSADTFSSEPLHFILPSAFSFSEYTAWLRSLCSHVPYPMGEVQDSGGLTRPLCGCTHVRGNVLCICKVH